MVRDEEEVTVAGNGMTESGVWSICEGIESVLAGKHIRRKGGACSGW